MYVYDSGSIVYCLDFPAISTAMKYQEWLEEFKEMAVCNIDQLSNMLKKILSYFFMVFT